MAKIMKKAQTGKNVPKGMVESEMFPGKMIPKSKSNYANGEYAKMLQAGKASAPKAKVKPKAQSGKSVDSLAYYKNKMSKFQDEARRMDDSSMKYSGKSTAYIDKMTPAQRKAKGASKVVNKDGSVTYKYKSGGMLKRADGSYSKRGLWDNIRANRGSGKKPTAAMLKQERKIKSKTKK